MTSKKPKKIVDFVQHKDYEYRVVFLNSWNEWGEGNYVEPDEEFGRLYLDVLHNLNS